MTQKEIVKKSKQAHTVFYTFFLMVGAGVAGAGVVSWVMHQKSAQSLTLAGVDAAVSDELNTKLKDLQLYQLEVAQSIQRQQQELAALANDVAEVSRLSQQVPAGTESQMRQKQWQDLLERMEKMENWAADYQDIGNVLDPAQVFMGHMIHVIVNNYHRGGPQGKHLTHVNRYITAVMRNEELQKSMAELMAITPEEGPVTLEELRFLANNIYREGPPQFGVPAEETRSENWWAYVDSWAKIRKVDNTRLKNWQQSMYDLQLAVSQGRVASASAVYDVSPLLRQDERLQKFAERMHLYLEQQQKLNKLFRSFVDSYVYKPDYERIYSR